MLIFPRAQLDLFVAFLEQIGATWNARNTPEQVGIFIYNGDVFVVNNGGATCSVTSGNVQALAQIKELYKSVVTSMKKDSEHDSSTKNDA